MIDMNWHDKYTGSRTVGDRFADQVANFVGSWIFVTIHIVWFSSWIIFQVEEFPYGLLTMTVSLEAIFLTTFIMMSQNRQSRRDRAQAEADYETNLKAKSEIEELQTRLARIENEKLDKILRILDTKA